MPSSPCFSAPDWAPIPSSSTSVPARGSSRSRARRRSNGSSPSTSRRSCSKPSAATIGDRGLSNVTTVEAGFLTYEHHGDPVDLVYSRYALHHLPDFWKAIALDRLAAILRPGGLLRLWDVVFQFDAADAPARLEAWLAVAAAADGDTGWTRPELEEHLRDEHSTFTWLLEPMLDRAGFDITDAQYTDDGISARYLCCRR